MIKLPKTLLEILHAKKYKKLNGEEKNLNDSLSESECLMVCKAIESVRAKTTLETGVASGISAMAICEALKTIHEKDNITIRHFGVDPNQNTDYGSAALIHLKKENLDSVFTLLEGPSHIMLPKLIEENVTIDFALIDGWHTFDYTLLDFFLIDKLAKPGAIIAFHDCYSVSKQKVLRYIETHRKYEYATEFFVRNNEPFLKTFKFFIWRIWLFPSLLFSKFHWRYQLKNSSGLFFIRKKEQFEPNYDFYKSF